jgi:hypothetical protein
MRVIKVVYSIVGMHCYIIEMEICDVGGTLGN